MMIHFKDKTSVCNTRNELDLKVTSGSTLKQH